MASGQVGRLSVRVLPDTTRFREDLKKVLERAEKSLSVNIEATVELAQGTLEKVKAQLQSLDAEIPATIDTKGMKSRVEAILHTLDTDLPIGATQSESFQAELEALRQTVENIDAEVPVVPHISNTFRLRTRLMHLTRPRLVDIVVRLNRASYMRAATALAALGGIRAVDDIRKQMNRVTKNIDRVAGVLGVVLPLIGTLSALLVGGAGAFLTLGGSLAAIIPGLLALPGLLTGSLVGIGVMVAALWDFSTVLEDLVPKYDHLQNLISNNFWKKAEAPIRNLALKALPMLEDGLGGTATALGGFFSIMADTLARPKNLDLLGASFGFLSEAIEIASKGIEPFTNAIIQLGTVGMSYMPSLATAFNGMAESFEDWVSTNVESGQMFIWIDTAIQNIKDLGRVIGASFGILSGFHQAASNAGGPGLGDLADGLERVDAAIKSPAWQGALTTVFLGASQAIDALGPGMQALADTFIDMAPVIGQIMVMSGQLVSDGFEAIAAVFQQPAFQGGLLSFFEGLLAGSGDLADAMPGIGDTLGAIFTTMGDLAEVMGPVLGAAFEALGPVMQDLMSVISAIAPVIGDVLVGAIELVAPYIQAITGAIAEWVQNNPELATTIIAIVGAIGGLVTAAIAVISGLSLIIGSVLSIISFLGTMGLTFGAVAAAVGKFIAIAAGVVAVVAAIIGAFIAAWNSSEEFRNTIMGLGESIWGFIQTIISYLVPAFQAIGEGIMGLVSSIIDGVIPFITGLVDIFAALWGILEPIAMFLLSILGPAFMVVGQFIGDLIGIIGTLLGGVLAALGEAFSFIADLLTGDFSGAWEHLLSLFTGLGEMIETIVQQLFEMGVNLVQGLWEGILSAADGLITLITGWVQGLIDTVKGLFGIASPSTVFMGMGVDIVLGLINGLVSMIGSLISSAVALGTQLLANIVNFVVNIYNAVDTWFRNASSAAITAISTMVSTVISFVLNLVGNIISFVTSIKDSIQSGFETAKQMAIDAFQKLVSGVIEKIGTLISEAKAIPGKITSALGDLGTLLYSAGIDVISGMINGVKDKAGDLVEAAKGAVGSAVEGAKNLLGINSPSKVFMEIGEYTGQGMIIGLEHKAKGVADAMSAMVEPPSLPSIGLTEDESGAPRSHAEDVVAAMAGWQPMVQIGNRQFYGTMVDSAKSERRSLVTKPA